MSSLGINPQRNFPTPRLNRLVQKATSWNSKRGHKKRKRLVTQDGNREQVRRAIGKEW